MIEKPKNIFEYTLRVFSSKIINFLDGIFHYADGDNYIFISKYGCSFYPAGKKAHDLENESEFAQIYKIKTLGNAVLFICKLTIVVFLMLQQFVIAIEFVSFFRIFI